MLLQSVYHQKHAAEWHIKTALWDEPDCLFVQTIAKSSCYEYFVGAHFLVFKEGGKWLVTKDGAPHNLNNETCADAIMSAALTSSYEAKDYIGGVFLRTEQPMRLKSELKHFG